MGLRARRRPPEYDFHTRKLGRRRRFRPGGIRTTDGSLKPERGQARSFTACPCVHIETYFFHKFLSNEILYKIGVSSAYPALIHSDRTVLYRVRSTDYCMTCTGVRTVISMWVCTIAGWVSPGGMRDPADTHTCRPETDTPGRTPGSTGGARWVCIARQTPSHPSPYSSVERLPLTVQSVYIKCTLAPQRER